MMDFVRTYIVTEVPAANIDPPIILSFIYIAKIGDNNPNPPKKNMSYKVRYFKILFIIVYFNF